MIVKLWVQQIKLGKKTIDDVPRLLKEKVISELSKETLKGCRVCR